MLIDLRGSFTYDVCLDFGPPPHNLPSFGHNLANPPLGQTSCPYLRGFLTQRWRSYLRLPPQVRRRHPLRCDGGARAARRRAADGGALSEEALLLLLLLLVPDEGEDDVAKLVDEVDVAAPRVILLLAAILVRSLIDSVMVFLIPFLFCCYLGLCEFL